MICPLHPPVGGPRPFPCRLAPPWRRRRRDRAARARDPRGSRHGGSATRAGGRARRREGWRSDPLRPYSLLSLSASRAHHPARLVSSASVVAVGAAATHRDAKAADHPRHCHLHRGRPFVQLGRGRRRCHHQSLQEQGVPAWCKEHLDRALDDPKYQGVKTDLQEVNAGQPRPTGTCTSCGSLPRDARPLCWTARAS